MLVLVSCLAAFAGRPDTDALAAHAIPLSERSMDAPLDDLAPLAARLAGVQVVYLGESTHDDGGASVARLRLIRWLHEELGFDTRVYEASRESCLDANTALASGSSADDVLPDCAWPFWSRATQVAPLRAYLDAQQTAGTPLHIAGVDPQNFDGDGEALVTRLAASLEAVGGPVPSPSFRTLAARVAVSAWQGEAMTAHPGSPLGRVGGVYSRASRPVTEPRARSVEGMLRDAGVAHAFVDLRDPPADVAWLQEGIELELNGFRRRGSWADVLDGVLVIPETEPVRYPSTTD